MKFLWTTIIVKDMEESLKFYQEIVGLKIADRFKAGPNMEIVFLGEGETKIELIYNEKFDSLNAGNSVTLGFKANALDEMIKLLNEKQIEIKTGPIQPNPNFRYIIINDPNGVKIQFAEQQNS